MTTLESTTATIQLPPSGCEAGEAQLAAAASWPATTADPGRLPTRHAQLLPLGSRRRPGRAGDLRARPIYHKRSSIDAHLAIVFAALAVTRFIEDRTGWSIKKFVRTARRYRTVHIRAGQHLLTAEDLLPPDSSPEQAVRTNLIRVGARFGADRVAGLACLRVEESFPDGCCLRRDRAVIVMAADG